MADIAAHRRSPSPSRAPARTRCCANAGVLRHPPVAGTTRRRRSAATPVSIPPTPRPAQPTSHRVAAEPGPRQSPRRRRKGTSAPGPAPRPPAGGRISASRAHLVGAEDVAHLDAHDPAGPRPSHGHDNRAGRPSPVWQPHLELLIVQLGHGPRRTRLSPVKPFSELALQRVSDARYRITQTPASRNRGARNWRLQRRVGSRQTETSANGHLMTTAERRGYQQICGSDGRNDGDRLRPARRHAPGARRHARRRAKRSATTRSGWSRPTSPPISPATPARARRPALRGADAGRRRRHRPLHRAPHRPRCLGLRQHARRLADLQHGRGHHRPPGARARRHRRQDHDLPALRHARRQRGQPRDTRAG